MTVSGPDYARSVAMAREARGCEAPVGAERPHRRPTRAVLGLALAGIAAISLGGRHAGVGGASLDAAADAPTARTEEVDAMRSVVAIAGAVLASSIALADGKVPPGWMVIADSSTQMTNVQGGNGWSYWFTVGDGSTPQPMQPSVFADANPNFEYLVWSPSPVMGCSTQVTACHILSQVDSSNGETMNNMHGNRLNCCTPAAGRQDPMLRWVAPLQIPARISLFGKYSFVGGLDQPVRLSVNEQSVFLGNETDFGSTGSTIWIEASALQGLSLKYEACGNFSFKLRILTPDCNGNLIADAVEISNGSAGDANGDGVPDGCQCFADVIQNGSVDGADLSALLTVWGTAGGIYPRADANGDGVVNGSDLSIVLSGWGACPQ